MSEYSNTYILIHFLSSKIKISTIRVEWTNMLKNEKEIISLDVEYTEVFSTFLYCGAGRLISWTEIKIVTNCH